MYRYAKKEYNKSLLGLGIIRIGTLYDFRRLEHEQGISDPKEGKKTVSHTIEKLHISDTSDQELKENKDYQALGHFHAIKFEGDCKNINIENISMRQEIEIDDCFILCTSKHLSSQVMEQFEGADSCVEICQTLQFYKILTDTINTILPVTFRFIGEVSYQDRDEKWNGVDWGRHPAVIKGTEFANQAEIRAIWTPRYGQNIEPIIISNYRLTGLCKEISI